MTTTPIDESNLAHIGSREDAAARKAAAETEVNWDDAGKDVGIKIWRVENKRDENGNPKFGINPWPIGRYGEFYSGDSYIVLETTRNEDSEKFMYDIYFWIGSESSQDEYVVAAYKSNELDDLLDDIPVQHREVQFHESNDFLKCFEKKSIKYFDGGVDSGFRYVDESSGKMELPARLFHVRRDNRVTRCVQVPAKCDSLNQGDAFILHTGDVVYTWFGQSSSPFEKSKAAEVAHNMVLSSTGDANLVEDVDDNEDFWSALGGKGDIKPAISASEESSLNQYGQETKMYVLSDVDSILRVEEVQASMDNLMSGDVCMIDASKSVYIWIGSDSSKREQSQAMLLVQNHIKSLGLVNKSVVRVKEGQENRVAGFCSALSK